jgi:hypothetical protein
MSDRSHLIRDTTVDVNGHPKTVYRKPGDPAPTNNSRSGGIGAPISSRLVKVVPDHSQEFPIAADKFDSRWAETNRVKYADDYINEFQAWNGWNDYNPNGTLNAQSGDDGILYFVEPHTGDLVLTGTPGEFYIAAISSPPVVEPIESGYKITYVSTDYAEDDNHLTTFNIDAKGDYTGEPGTLDTFGSNLDAESALGVLRGEN